MNIISGFLIFLAAVMAVSCGDAAKDSLAFGNYSPTIDAGHGHIAVIDINGQVHTKGRNDSGQLGSGKSDIVISVQKVDKDLVGVVVDLGRKHSICLSQDGTVWAWGDNFYGQLGTGTNVNNTKPIEVEKLNDIRHVSAGGDSSYAVDLDGNVWAWGDNYFGQLGDGTYNNSNVPKKISGLSKISTISAGGSYCVAVDEDNNLWVWGNNNYGQLGIGSQISSTVPVKIESIKNVRQISAGTSHCIAVKDDGSVYVWGNNISGNLGVKDSEGNIDATSCILTPSNVAELKNIVGVSAGGSEKEVFSVALTEKGQVYTWGGNFSGQLGDGTSESKYEPVLLKDIKDVLEVAAGPDFFIALNKDYKIFGCGKNSDGQINSIIDTQYEPEEIMQLDMF